MRRGGFDPQDQRCHPLYAFENPMYSKVLVAWRSEHRKWIRNAGAPDYAGIRSQSRAAEAQQPVGFFQVKRQPLEPPVARDAEPSAASRNRPCKDRVEPGAGRTRPG